MCAIAQAQFFDYGSYGIAAGDYPDRYCRLELTELCDRPETRRRHSSCTLAPRGAPSVSIEPRSDRIRVLPHTVVSRVRDSDAASDVALDDDSGCDRPFDTLMNIRSPEPAKTPP